MKYKVACHWSLDEFQTLVTLYLSEGWTLAGGVSMVIGGDEVRYLQALTK